MKTLLVILMIAAWAAFLIGDSSQAGSKDFPWKPFLSDDAYEALCKRSTAAIEAAAKSDRKDAAERVEVEAAVLIGYTMSVKNRSATDVNKMRGAAVGATLHARNGELKKVADFGKSIATAAPHDQDGVTRKPFKVNLQELTWLMEIFKNSKKGGDGLHADLHYHPKLKNLDGLEALIGALAGKKLSEENAAKVAKELPLAAYRMAAVGSITHEFAPAKGAGQWRDLSNQMRDASVALAEAATKKDADGIQKAATSLENSCTQCHSVFKSK